MQPMTDWSDLRFFLEVARTGTLAAAGHKLGVDNTTVGRRLSALERDLGSKLFARTPDGLVLTAAGEAIRTAGEEMEQAVLEYAATADVVVMAAAVADFRPKSIADQKIKKGDGIPDVMLEPTPDILAALGQRKRPGQILVGFAAETIDVVASAADKLRRKGLDLIVANDVSAPGAGFEHDTNEVVVIGADGSEQHVPLTDKRLVAGMVLDAVVACRRSAE